jgi:hypothetical protein
MNKQLSVALQLSILILSIFFALILASILNAAVFNVLHIDVLTKPSDLSSKSILISAFLNQFIGFLGGFFLFLKLTKQSFTEVVHFKVINRRTLYITIVILLISYPIVELLAYFNEGLKQLLPDNPFILAGEQTKLIQQKLLTEQGIGLLLIKLLVIAVLPAIAEELIFRGILLKKLYESSNNKHYAVLISSLIFAAVHIQPLVILPMFFLGCILGYLYTKTNNIIYSMIFHFLFNASTILLGYFFPEYIS